MPATVRSAGENQDPWRCRPVPDHPPTQLAIYAPCSRSQRCRNGRSGCWSLHQPVAMECDRLSPWRCSLSVIRQNVLLTAKDQPVKAGRAYLATRLVQFQHYAGQVLCSLAHDLLAIHLRIKKTEVTATAVPS